MEETIIILKGIQKKYEDYHHVHYTDAAIEAAATLSNRYIQDRFLPDKAIDLLDEAGSKNELNFEFCGSKGYRPTLNRGRKSQGPSNSRRRF